MAEITAFGESLLRRREALAWTHDDVARRVGCDARDVLAFERGERAPTDSQIGELADVLDMDRRALFLAAHPDLTGVLSLGGAPRPRAEWPAGLRALAEDTARRAILDVTDDELERLSGLQLGDRPTTVEQFCALLLMVRHIFRWDPPPPQQ